MCHVTGGGLLNFLRLSRFGFRFDNPLPPPEIFRWIQETGKFTGPDVPDVQHGYGVCDVVPPESVDAVTKLVEGTRVVGEIIEKPGAWLGNVQVT